jgi:hypothetical protein
MLTEKPRKGQRIAWRKESGKLYCHCVVVRVEGDLCWAKFDSGVTEPFIWWFKREGIFNRLAEVIREPAFNKKTETAHAQG